MSGLRCGDQSGGEQGAVLNCQKCGVENDDANAFCTGCGGSLGRVCAACGHRSPDKARFCGQCGSAFDATRPAGSPTHPASPSSRLAREGERKLLTVLFADVAGSTELIAALDPEEAERRLTPALEAMRVAVRRFEGTTVRMQGDGVMALFGAPRPQEDHALRACCAALAMQAAIADLPGDPPKIRVGIHSGDVLARAIETDVSVEYDVTGMAVHVAARLEKIAQDGGIVISDATWRAARQFLDARSLGPQPLRGLAEPIGVWLLTGLRRGPATGRFRSERTLSGLVGRSAELDTLTRAFDRASVGDARIIGVVGEAGVGKSRLCFELAEACRARGAHIVHARAFAHTRATPFEPVVDLWCDSFGVNPGDPPENVRDKIATRVLALDPALRTELPLLWEFVGVGDKDNPPPRLDPAVRRDKLLSLVARFMRSDAISQPMVIVLEDLHWLDPGSEMFLEALVDALPGTRMLAVLNFRPGYTASWMGRSYYSQLSLAPLPADAADALAGDLLGGDDSVAPLSARLRDRARGNPFFLEELVRTLADHGYLAGEHGDYRLLREPDERLLPDTVQAVIAARTDLRSELERRILQAAAVMGREFRPDILRQVADLEESDVRAALHRLVAAELVYEATAGGTTTFTFKNPMTQEVVYRSVPAERRRSLHTRVADTLNRELPDPNGSDAGLVAYHLEEAGNIIMAAAQNLKAAMWHGTRDTKQALDAWMRVRRLIRSQPIEGPAQKLPLMMACGQIVNFGWREGVPLAEAEGYYDEAMALARELGDLRGITLITAAHGRMLGAVGSADDYVTKVRGALELVQGEEQKSLKYTLTAILCQALRLAGFPEEALKTNDEALAGAQHISDEDQRTLGFNVAMWLTGMRGQILAMIEQWDAAREAAMAVLDGKFGEPDPLHRLQAHSVLADIAVGQKDAKALAEQARVMAEVVEPTGNPYLLVYARGYAGLAAGINGDLAGGTHILRDTLAYARKRRAGLENEPRILADLADLQLRSGNQADARSMAVEAIKICQARCQRTWKARATQVLSRLGSQSTEQTQSQLADHSIHDTSGITVAS